MPFILFLFFLIACGKNPTFKISKSDEVVVGKINWIDVSKNLRPEILSNTKPVADIFIPTNQTRCTGFLISENLLMTNYHCVSDALMAVGVLANFAHEIDSLAKNEYSCEKFIYGSKENDFSILECEEDPGRELGFLKLENSQPEFGETVYLVHHNCDYFGKPGCDYTKKISFGKVSKVGEGGIFNTTDSLLGSSGSPLFSAKTGKFIGIHHAGKVTRNNQRGPYNVAIPSNKILSDLLRNGLI